MQREARGDPLHALSLQSLSALRNEDHHHLVEADALEGDALQSRVDVGDFLVDAPGEVRFENSCRAATVWLARADGRFWTTPDLRAIPSSSLPSAPDQNATT